MDDQPFDYIHGRYLACSIKNYPRLLKQCYKHTAPGGWVEMQDWDLRIYSEDGSTKGTSIQQYYNYVLPAFERTGVVVYPGPSLEKWFREAGFVDIHVEKYRVPLGTWPKDPYYVCIYSPGVPQLLFTSLTNKPENTWDLEFAAS